LALQLKDDPSNLCLVRPDPSGANGARDLIHAQTIAMMAKNRLDALSQKHASPSCVNQPCADRISNEINRLTILTVVFS
jgi:hypothetical protein